MSSTEDWMAHSQAKCSRYRIVNHQEAGLFDSMTAATIWALKNLKDWNWGIEPVSRAVLISQISTPPDEELNKPRL